MNKTWIGCLSLLVFLAIAKVLVAQTMDEAAVNKIQESMNTLPVVVNEAGNEAGNAMMMNEDMEMHQEGGY